MKGKLLNGRKGKRLISLLIALVMVTTLMQGTGVEVHAATCIHESENWKPVKELDDFTVDGAVTVEHGTNYNEIIVEHSANYYLTEDLVIDCSLNCGGMYFTYTGLTAAEHVINICLNGHVIYSDPYNVIECPLICVEDHITVNIYDCHPEKPHKLGKYTDDDYTEYYYGEAATEGYETLYGGMLVGNYEGTITLYGSESNFNLYNGTITGGFSIGESSVGYYGRGGGVCVGENATFTMYDGCITKNVAYGKGDDGCGAGGGVYVADRGTFKMHGGTISENVATTGGGVAVEPKGTFIADGGVITNNTAFLAGGGVYSIFPLIGESGDYSDPYYTCLAAGTPVTLADGSRTNIENLKVGDEVRVFDHESGELSSSPLLSFYKYPEPKGDAFTLHFTDDIDVTAVGGHCFFEKSANKYVNITKENAESFIGHEFYNADEARWETLTSVDFLPEAVDTYVIVSEKTLNTLANGMLSNVDGLYSKLCNIFEMDENLKIDADKKAADIEKYGLWEYDSEHFEYVSKSAYEKQNLQYLGIAIGKGLITYEELKEAVEYYIEYTKNMDTSSGNEELVIDTDQDIPQLSSSEPETGIYLGGSVKITGNISGDNISDNLFVWNDFDASSFEGPLFESQKVYMLDDKKPTSDMKVGITMQAIEPDINSGTIEGVNTTGIFLTNVDEEIAGYFVSDKPNYYIEYKDRALALSCHNHDWKYTAGTGDNANKITAKCEGKWDCTVSNGKTTGVSLTLSATSQNYSGNAAVISIGTDDERTAWEDAELTLPTDTAVEYYKGAEKLAVAPTTPGDYTAKLTIGGAKASIDYTISVAKNAEEIVFVNNVITKIKEIGTVEYTDACKAKIDAARKVYDGLAEHLTSLVTNYNVLTAAEKEYAKLKGDAESVDAVVTLIKEIGTVEYTDACKAKIDVARKAYDSLADHLTSRVTNYNVLTAAEGEYAKLKAVTDKLVADTAAANSVDKLINSIGTVEYTDACKAKIDAARKSYEALTADQKKLVKELKTLEDAEKAYEALESQLTPTKEYATQYDTLETIETVNTKGKVTGITIPSGSTSMNGILTVNDKLKITILDGKWKVTGYSEDRVTPETLNLVNWLATAGTNKDAKILKKYAKTKYYKATKKRNAKTCITALTNKKDADGVYSVRLADDMGNVIILNIERVKSLKKSTLKTSVSGISVSANGILAMEDGESVKTVDFSFAGKNKVISKSALNNNVLIWKVGTGKKAKIVKYGEVTEYTTKNGNIIGYLTVTKDGSIKVLAGSTKGKLPISATVNGKVYKVHLSIKK